MNDSLSAEATRRARRVSISPALMEEAMLKDRAGRQFSVEFENAAGGPFYRPAQEGPTRVLYVNIDHPFFLDFYMADNVTREQRTQIELFLWALAVSELDAAVEDEVRYAQERAQWSRYLADALPALAEILAE